MDFLNFTSYDLDTWTTFFQENWLMLVIALIVLFLIIRIVKTVIKWAIVAVIVIGLVIYSGYTLEDVKELGSKVMESGLDDLKELGSKAADAVKQEAVSAMAGEAKDAKYTVNSDGTYTVKTTNIELRGEVGASEVKVSLRGAPAFTMKLDDTIQQFINQSKQNG